MMLCRGNEVDPKKVPTTESSYAVFMRLKYLKSSKRVARVVLRNSVFGVLHTIISHVNRLSKTQAYRSDEKKYSL